MGPRDQFSLLLKFVVGVLVLKGINLITILIRCILLLLDLVVELVELFVKWLD